MLCAIHRDIRSRTPQPSGQFLSCEHSGKSIQTIPTTIFLKRHCNSLPRLQLLLNLSFILVTIVKIPVCFRTNTTEISNQQQQAITMNHSSSSLILVFTTPLYLTVICIIGLHLAQPVTAIAAAKHLKDFRPFSKQFGVPASPLPCKLRLDDPLCPFEDNFQKFDRNFWIRANNFSKKPTTIYSCWMSKSNAKKIRKKKAPEGIVKLKVKNKENIFENTFIPFSCGEIFSRKRFGVGCYEAVMKPSLIFR